MLESLHKKMNSYPINFGCWFYNSFAGEGNINKPDITNKYITQKLDKYGYGRRRLLSGKIYLKAVYWYIW